MSTLTPPAKTVPGASPPGNAQPHGPFAALRRAMPAGEVIRYLIVGGWNTVFGYLVYSGFVNLYGHVLPQRYLPAIVVIASLSARPISITMAFFCYKHFVFRTTGNYLKEWLRCFAVYGVGMLPELIALPILTKLFLSLSFTHKPAPYLAGAILTIFTTVYSYFAHKKFSFKR